MQEAGEGVGAGEAGVGECSGLDGAVQPGLAEAGEGAGGVFGVDDEGEEVFDAGSAGVEGGEVGDRPGQGGPRRGDR
ncbi:hypothetical protein RhoFasK5_01661|nr:hypothetical protein [Rhodococcus kroppenstedtii]